MENHAEMFPRRTVDGEYISNVTILHTSDRIRAWQKLIGHPWINLEVVVINDYKTLKVTSKIHEQKVTFLGCYSVEIPDYMILSDKIYEVELRWLQNQAQVITRQK